MPDPEIRRKVLFTDEFDFEARLSFIKIFACMWGLNSSLP